MWHSCKLEQKQQWRPPFMCVCVCICGHSAAEVTCKLDVASGLIAEHCRGRARVRSAIFDGSTQSTQIHSAAAMWVLNKRITVCSAVLNSHNKQAGQMKQQLPKVPSGSSNNTQGHAVTARALASSSFFVQQYHSIATATDGTHQRKQHCQVYCKDITHRGSAICNNNCVCCAHRIPAKRHTRHGMQPNTKLCSKSLPSANNETTQVAL